MAHDNAWNRYFAVKEMMKSTYTTKEMKALAKEYNTTYCAVFNDVVTITFLGSTVSRHINSATKKLIATRDNNTCQYCGITDVPMIAEHVIPYIKGGCGKEYNVVSACKSCNAKKRSKVIIPNNIEVLKSLNPEWCDKIYKLAERHNYSHTNWLAFKEHHELTNKKIAEIIGTSEQNVKIMTNPKKPLSTWMKAFLYSWVNEVSGVGLIIEKTNPKELKIWAKKIVEIPISEKQLSKLPKRGDMPFDL